MVGHGAEAADNLVCADRHDVLLLVAGTPIIFITERDVLTVERYQASVRDRNPMGVAREIGQCGLWTREAV